VDHNINIGTGTAETIKENDMEELTNHRGRQERRLGDSALAVGCFDRRHNVERRLPEMAVLRLSDIDWQKYFGASIKLSEKSEHKIFHENDVFNKSRNS
jgi:hypothetical protein